MLEPQLAITYFLCGCAIERNYLAQNLKVASIGFNHVIMICMEDETIFIGFVLKFYSIMML